MIAQTEFAYRKFRLAPFFAAALFLGAVDARAQLSDEAVLGARDAVRGTFDPARAGIVYAASIDFAVQPDIATADFSLDGLEDTGIGDPHLRNARLPLRHRFDLENESLSAFIQGTIGYQDLSMELPLGEGGSDVVRTDWRARGIDIGAGLEYRLTSRWTLLPSLNVGVADLQNKADYGGSPLGPILRPVFEGIVFDWDTNAWIAGAALGARYERPFDRFRLLANMSASSNHIRSFDESSPDIVIRDTASTLDLEINTVHPLGEFAGLPTELVTVLGATSLVGDARGELGFDEFAELGLALQFELGERSLLPGAIRIGAKAIIGPDVSGWSLIIGRGI